jgi:hypothetical protein
LLVPEPAPPARLNPGRCGGQVLPFALAQNNRPSLKAVPKKNRGGCEILGLDQLKCLYLGMKELKNDAVFLALE